jgi:hypothetical protein
MLENDYLDLDKSGHASKVRQMVTSDHSDGVTKLSNKL